MPVRPECEIRRGQTPTLRLGFAVEACSEFRRGSVAALDVPCESFRWKAMPKHVYIFLKTDMVEDSLCAPGSPMLRSKDVA